MIDRLLEIRGKVQERSPLVHCLTNPISINDCANAALAVGAKPIMAEHPEEVAEITAGADALLLNLGNITDVRMASMETSAQVARERGIPMVLDLVGVACSSLRLRFSRQLVSGYRPTLIKGNPAEVAALLQGRTLARGVDARESDRKESVGSLLALARTASQEWGAAVLISGPVDAICRGDGAVTCQNGHPMLGSLTGTGCMLGVLAAAYSTQGDPLEAAALAALLEGVAGEVAATQAVGNGSFRVALLDALTALSDEELCRWARLAAL